MKVCLHSHKKQLLLSNTGHAAMLIMDEVFGSEWSTKNISTLFIGDDTSDEDVMKVKERLEVVFH